MIFYNKLDPWQAFGAYVSEAPFRCSSLPGTNALAY